MTNEIGTKKTTTPRQNVTKKGRSQKKSTIKKKGRCKEGNSRAEKDAWKKTKNSCKSPESYL